MEYDEGNRLSLEFGEAIARLFNSKAVKAA
jgi:hypothetical protein